jgi:hypothetical protein
LDAPNIRKIPGQRACVVPNLMPFGFLAIFDPAGEVTFPELVPLPSSVLGRRQSGSSCVFQTSPSVSKAPKSHYTSTSVDTIRGHSTRRVEPARRSTATSVQGRETPACLHRSAPSEDSNILARRSMSAVGWHSAGEALILSVFPMGETGRATAHTAPEPDALDARQAWL